MRFSVLNSDAERREGLKALLRQVDRQARFGEAQDWPQAERTLRRLQPDLLLIDWEDWMSPADARALLVNHPGLPVAVLVDDISPAHVRAFVEKGVLGVIPRSTDPRVIVRALEMVLLGVHYIPAGALSLDGRASPGRRVRQLDDPRSLELFATPKRSNLTGGLSPRQEQIMRCVHMGSTNKMIARALGISEGTVKIHLATIFQQLGAPNRAAAVAIYNGWLTAQLEVLRSGQNRIPRQARVAPNVVPLRQRKQRTFRYPLPGSDTPATLPMAAEATAPYGARRPSAERDDGAM
ncbi:response regulator transcription factor [Paraburkholderia phymatum]|uniref:Two component transcriptional regulator, LuxR family n=1 Tax=Paraburkholderia phymatum (strain DSM 17167 / CIP 108236 / LMG 21445 / STM815) TaxID=391038 RepID=B2JDJ4_PARP8|nr:response regulator transcription factor [Paraburkholderia phymatum]ACC71154.1 two component transcriptional regulator, LuxR family [Paraburkholderia phymatum STM815]